MPLEAVAFLIVGALLVALYLYARMLRHWDQCARNARD